MWKLKIFGLVLLGSCGVVFTYAEPIAPEETTIKSDVDEVTLSTELRPPPLPAAGEHRGIVYLINLFAVKNKSDETPDGNSENDLEPESPEIIGPLASVLFVVDNSDKEGLLDDLTKLSVEADYEAEDTDTEKDLEGTKVDPIVSEASKARTDKPENVNKIRNKRTPHWKNGGHKHGGGYGGNYGNYGDGGHSNRRGSQPAYGIYVIPVYANGGGHGHDHGGGYNHGYGHGGGHGSYPSQVHYPGGGGNQWSNGGAQANAYASASASSWSQSSAGR